MAATVHTKVSKLTPKSAVTFQKKKPAVQKTQMTMAQFLKKKIPVAITTLTKMTVWISHEIQPQKFTKIVIVGGLQKYSLRHQCDKHKNLHALRKDLQKENESTSDDRQIDVLVENGVSSQKYPYSRLHGAVTPEADALSATRGGRARKGCPFALPVYEGVGRFVVLVQQRLAKRNSS